MAAQETAEGRAAAHAAEAQQLRAALGAAAAERDALRARAADAELADHAATLRLSELKQLYSGCAARRPAARSKRLLCSVRACRLAQRWRTTGRRAPSGAEVADAAVRRADAPRAR